MADIVMADAAMGLLLCCAKDSELTEVCCNVVGLLLYSCRTSEARS